MSGLSTGARRQDAAYRQHWLDLQRRDAVPGALTWVVLGDSAAVGLGAPSVEQSYVSVAARLLHAGTGRPLRVVNLARSGVTAATVLADQVPQLHRWTEADLVTCVVGGNDVAWRRRFDLPGFAATVDAVAQRLPEGAVLGLVPTFGHWPFDGRVRVANEAIRAAAQRCGLRVADLASASGRTWPERVGLLSPDFFHPNARGHARWAQAVSAAALHDVSGRP